MFHSARIKLTIWYIVISMSISIFFSCGIYFILHRELQRNERRMNFSIQMMSEDRGTFDREFMRRRNMVELTERAMALNLLYVNIIILIFSSLAGYFMAGRTLRPIQEIVVLQNQFVADASHELRTPLTSLKTAIEVNLRDKNIDLKQAKTVLQENLDDVNKLQRLSEHLLALASFKTNPVRPSEKVDLASMLKLSVQSILYQAKEKNISVKQSYEKVKTAGDSKKLSDAFVIFLENAVKYSPPKTTIHVSLVHTDGHAKIQIKDQGIGIDKKDQQKIFERFFRADSSRSKSTGGYGLGLAIAKEIIDAHNGSIDVESELKKGTTFTVILPITQKV